jgi:hypothetical protein
LIIRKRKALLGGLSHRRTHFASLDRCHVRPQAEASWARALSSSLDAVSTAVLLKDIGTAKLQLKKIIKALPAPPSGTVACTSECSGLLAYNAQYLLDHFLKTTDRKK